MYIYAPFSLEDTVHKNTSTVNQEPSFHQQRNLLVFWPGSSQTLELCETVFICKLLRLWYFVIAVRCTITLAFIMLREKFSVKYNEWKIIALFINIIKVQFYYTCSI